MTIAFTKSSLPFGWLGNMAGGFPVQFHGLSFPSTEHLFQWLRFEDEAIREKIRAAKNAFAAKLVAKQYAEAMVVEPCSERDLTNMQLCLRLKVEQHPNLKRELLETGDRLIVEDVTKRGGGGRNHFWGASLIDDRWVGKNVVGKQWMELRDELRRSNHS